MPQQVELGYPVPVRDAMSGMTQQAALNVVRDIRAAKGFLDRVPAGAAGRLIG